jgi:cytochrome c oxidase subunit 2
MAKDVDLLFGFVVAVSVFFSLLIAGLLISFAIRYRRRSDDDAPEAIHGSLALELTWSLIPFGLAMIMFVWGASIFVSLSRPPDNALDVFVVGTQWMWKLQHMEGRQEINELHVPIGQPVKLTLTSEDVIHSFYVPAFRIKMDAVPGRYTHTWFEATKPGKYHLFCAEYCGTKHSQMIGTVHVMEPQDYERWLSGSLGDEPPAEAGRKLFESLRCDSCHKDAPDARGPSLHGIFGTQVALADGGMALVNEEYVRESILRPMQRVTKGYEPVMPSFDGQIGEEEILQIIAYLKTLKGAPAAGGPR